MKHIVLLLLTLALPGCQTAPINADTVNALPEGSALCSKATGIWGTVQITVIRASQGVVTNGGIDASADCNLGLRNAPSDLPRLPPLPPMPKPRL